MYRKSIVITKRHAIVITINFSSRPHRFAEKFLPKRESAKPNPLRLLLTRICTIAHNDAQWQATGQKTALAKSNVSLTQKHRFPHCAHKGKTNCAHAKIPTRTRLTFLIRLLKATSPTRTSERFKCPFYG